MLSSESCVPFLVQVTFVGGRFVEVQVKMKVESLCDVSTKWMEEPITGGFRRTAERKSNVYVCCNCFAFGSYVLCT